MCLLVLTTTLSSLSFTTVLIENQKASSDFQSEFGYDIDEPNQAFLALASNQVGERFDCLSFTLEMPFKDTVTDPNPHSGWSGPRSAQFGRSILDAVKAIAPVLRA
jgi:murein tripeptide amidase MpaA